MSERMETLLRRAVQQKEDEERKMAAMTPKQRERYIKEWAARLAPQLVEDGCAIDRELNAVVMVPSLPVDDAADARIAELRRRQPAERRRPLKRK